MALALAWPADVAAAPGKDVMELLARAQVELAAARAPGTDDAAMRYAAAAELFGRAAGHMIEGEENRARRSDLLRKAVSAYREASVRGGGDPGPLRAALVLAINHVAALDSEYGRSAAKLPEHAQASALRDQLATRLQEIDPEEEARPPEPPKSVEPVPPHATGDRPIDGGSGARRWKIGLGTSLALTGVSLGAAIGTAIAVARVPFEGPLYRDIVDAHRRVGSFPGPDEDMCGESVNVQIDDACRTRDRTANAAIAMTAMTVLFAASSVVFGVLLARSKRPSLAAWHRHRPALIVSPAAGGAAAVAGIRF